MISVVVNARNAVYTSNDLITSGSIGIPVKFSLSTDFDGLSNIAVFQGSGVSVDVALTATLECVVPHEVLANAGGYLRIGVYGRNGDGSIAIPTVWTASMRILAGTVPSGVDPAAPTPDWTAQVQQIATEAYDMAEDVQERADRGEFDGFSPTVTVTDITGGHRVTITDAEGPHAFDVLDGTDGEDGRGIASAVLNSDYTLTLTYTDGTSYTTPSIRGAKGEDGLSPTATVTQTATGATITMTDAEGTTTAEIANGKDGDPGAPGFSPTITVTDIAGGHRVTITDETGPHSFDVMDGTGSVQDVQVAGTSVLDAQGVANVPMASANAPGVIVSGTIAVTGTTPTITALPGIRYVCGEVATLDITLPASGCIDVTFESGSTPTVLTVTSPSGVTMMWANGFDPTALDANTTYEINIMDGLGVAAQWT